MPTVNVYIDGFNLYFGCLKRTPFRWLDLASFSRTLVPRKFAIGEIKLFTSRVKATHCNPGVADRQDVYLRAVMTLPQCSIYYGHFLTTTVRMPLSKPTPAQARTVRVIKTEEKGSDVNLACHLLSDAYDRRCDASFLISNDSDLLEPIRLARRRLGMVVGIATPYRQPGRPSNVLTNEADFQRGIRTTSLRKSQFPTTLTDRRGTFHKPHGW